MNLDNATILKLAEHLENAELQAHDVTKITNDYPDMAWDDARTRSVVARSPAATRSPASSAASPPLPR